MNLLSLVLVLNATHWLLLVEEWDVECPQGQRVRRPGSPMPESLALECSEARDSSMSLAEGERAGGQRREW